MEGERSARTDESFPQHGSIVIMFLRFWLFLSVLRKITLFFFCALLSAGVAVSNFPRCWFCTSGFNPRSEACDAGCDASVGAKFHDAFPQTTPSWLSDGTNLPVPHDAFH